MEDSTPPPGSLTTLSVPCTYDNLHLHLPEPCKNSSKFAIKETISSRGGGVGGWTARAQRAGRSLPDIALVTRFQQLFIFISAGCEAAQRSERFFHDGSRSSSRDQTDRTRGEKEKKKSGGEKMKKERHKEREKKTAERKKDEGNRSACGTRGVCIIAGMCVSFRLANRCRQPPRATLPGTKLLYDTQRITAVSR